MDNNIKYHRGFLGLLLPPDGMTDTGAVAAGLALFVSLIHALDQGGFTVLRDPAYVGYAYWLLEIAGVITAVLLLARPRSPIAWMSALAVSAGPLLGYVVTRTVGLPRYHHDVGNWGKPLGIASLLVEGTLLVLSLVSLHTYGRRQPLPPFAAGEHLVTVVRRHPAILLRAALETFVGAFLAFVLARLSGPGELLTLAYFALFMLVRMLWKLLQWSVERVVITDQRIMVKSGLITHRVAEVLLNKVRPMRYERTAAGRRLGYATIVIEQGQELRTINYLPRPDALYSILLDSSLRFQ